MKAAAAEIMGYPEEEGVSYAVLKGRSNFLCVRRHQDTLRAGTIPDGELISNLDLWTSETETGDREDLPFRVPAGSWVEVASDGEDCSPPPALAPWSRTPCANGTSRLSSRPCWV